MCRNIYKTGTYNRKLRVIWLQTWDSPHILIWVWTQEFLFVTVVGVAVFGQNETIFFIYFTEYFILDFVLFFVPIFCSKKIEIKSHLYIFSRISAYLIIIWRIFPKEPSKIISWYTKLNFIIIHGHAHATYGGLLGKWKIRW